MVLANRVEYLGTGPLAAAPGFGGSRGAALAHARQRLESLSMPAIGRHRTMASSSLSSEVEYKSSYAHELCQPPAARV
jgi:hypothetical protein